MKINKKTLVYHAKQSSSVEDLTKRLGKNSEDKEKVWDKLLRLAPGAEDFLERNEALNDMRIAKIDGNKLAGKESRTECMRLTYQLMQKGYLNEKNIKLCNTENNKHKENNINNYTLNGVRNKSQGENVLVDQEVPRDILEKIISLT